MFELISSISLQSAIPVARGSVSWPEQFAAPQGYSPPVSPWGLRLCTGQVLQGAVTQAEGH